MKSIQVEIRITSVRSRGRTGGAIFAGITDANDYFVVVADYKMLPDSSWVDRAQIWRVDGIASDGSFATDGKLRQETHIRPTKLELLRPSGANLVNWIASSNECPGIGLVKARRLWERFGSDLPEVIDSADVEKLCEFVDHAAAVALVSAFQKYGHAQTLLWLDQMSIPRAVSSSVISYWGAVAAGRIRENPYVLCSFCDSWEVIDELALTRFSVSRDDGRRLISACEEALHRALEGGDTALQLADFKLRVSAILGDSRLVQSAIEAGLASGRVCERVGLIQAAGMAHIEESVASSLLNVLRGEMNGQRELLAVSTPTEQEARKTLGLYERMTSLSLTPEQQEAVVMAATSCLSIITGGAGTGKTTGLKALRHVLERHAPAGTKIHQLALAGRAARRMEQSTGQRSHTIAAFLRREPPTSGSTVVIDESSMVDVLQMYQVLRHLPHGVRIVLVGDPAQLPPIGPGLILHALAQHPAVPHTALKIVKRQSGASGIPSIAEAIRSNKRPAWSTYAGRGSGVSVVDCSSHELDDAIVRVYAELGGIGSGYDVQVLTPTRNGTGGMRALNRQLHERYAPREVPVQSISSEWGLVNERTADGESLFVGDLILYGANDETLGLNNGSLGRIVEAIPPSGPEAGVCAAVFEGERKILTANSLRHVTHAYTFTIHKAQGSEFTRVIVPIRSSRLLDNSLLYTAVTRGIEQVVLVGDITSAERAILRPSKSAGRRTLLPSLLTRFLELTPPSPRVNCDQL